MDEYKCFTSTYEKMKHLSSDGMSEVWLVKSKEEVYVMKSLSRQSNQTKKDAFLQEIEILKKLQHPGIPRHVETIISKDGMYEIMEYIEGTSIPLSILEDEEEIANIALQILDILQYIHQHDILYCDLKPEHLIMKQSRVYLIDFGASIKKNNVLQMRFGTRGYAAPEQYIYDDIDEKVDIYAFGKTMLAFLLCQPSPSTLLKENLRKLPQSCAFKYILCKSMSEDKTKRFSSIGAIQIELAKLYFSKYWWMKIWYRSLATVKYHWNIVCDVHWGAVKHTISVKQERKKTWKETTIP